MRIAITGGSGRVGRAVIARALADGHDVTSIDRVAPDRAQMTAAVDHRQVDTADYDDFEAAVRGADGLIHLAAYPGPGGRPDHVVHNNNVVGSYNALSIAAKLGIKRICQASSINATGAVYSRRPRYDYFPLDERHPTYNEDPYSLSKWICEEQGDSFARLHSDLSIASMRFHWVVAGREVATERAAGGEAAIKHVWGYTRADEAARACLLSLTVPFSGHEAFYIVAPRTMSQRPTMDLLREHYPSVEVREPLEADAGLYDCTKAARLLGWVHAVD
ncbi:MAG: NAD(P)-dependent oxidoreductase [Candidatus Dormiibacterota bacterium]